jgi:hypothetical protein
MLLICLKDANGRSIHDDSVWPGYDRVRATPLISGDNSTYGDLEAINDGVDESSVVNRIHKSWRSPLRAPSRYLLMYDIKTDSGIGLGRLASPRDR